MGVYRVQGIIKEEFVANVIQVEMQCHHLYATHYATRAANATVAYQGKHMIIDNDMV
jgi:hypothetical protein